MVSAAGSLATLLIAPIGQHLIVTDGWRTGAIAFVLIALIMALLGVLMGPKPPEVRTAADQDNISFSESLMAAARHPGFVAMTIAFFACGFQLMYITVHLPAFLAICGVPPTVSATALGVIGLGNAAGSLLFGYLGSRYSQKRLLALAYLFRTFTIVCFVAIPVSPASTIMFAATMGVLWLGVVPLVSALIAKLFGLKHFNTLFGFAFFSHQVGAFIGSWLGGLSFDLTGSYTMAWGSMVVIGTCAFLLQWFMDDQPRPTSGKTGIAIPATT
jgi:predicted MFS family arabinose efflux permease